MGVSTLTDTIQDPAGNVIATSSGTVVNFRLMANGSPTPGFRVSDGTNVASLVVTAASTLGTISEAVEWNSNIVPSGTYYVAEILCPTSQGGTQEWALISSSSVSPQNFRSALAAALPAFTPITTIPSSVLAANNIFTGTNTFQSTVTLNGQVALSTSTAGSPFSGNATWTLGNTNPALTFKVADWGTSLVITDDALVNNNVTDMAIFSGNVNLTNVLKYRKSRGTSATPTTVAKNDTVALFDWAAFDGTNTGLTDPDGHGYGGGAAEFGVLIDSSSSIVAGHGQTPARINMGTCLSAPMVDPGPIDDHLHNSRGWYSFGRRNTPGQLIDVIGGTLRCGPIPNAVSKPTVAAVGGGVGHTYQYQVVPVGAEGDGTASVASSSVVNSALGPAGRDWKGRTTTATNYNTIDYVAVDGALYYKVLQAIDASTFSFLFSFSGISGGPYIDDGTDTGVAYTPASRMPGGTVLGIQGVQTLVVSSSNSIADTQFYTTPADGMMIVCTNPANPLFAVRAGGAWKVTAVA